MLKTACASNETTESLFESEGFLLRVFRHLLDYGVHECRLVCRKWYEASRKLPLTLTLKNEQHAHLIAERFPNAVAVKTRARMVFSYMYESCFDQVLLRHVVPLNRLTQLELLVQGAFCLSDDFDQCFASMKQLEFLKVRLHLREPEGRRFYEALRHLTNLTGLSLEHWHYTTADSGARTELEKIQDFDAAAFEPFDTAGDWIFPNSTRLKKLSVHIGDALATHCQGRNFFSVVWPYVSSLESLNFRFYALDPVRDMSPLTEMQSLKSLTVELLTKSESDTNLFEVLPEMTQLRDLELITTFNHTCTDALRAVLSMTWLKSLKPRRYGVSDRPLPLAAEISRLTQTTKLYVHSQLLTTSLSKLTQLVDLEIYVGQGIRIPPSFAVHTNLEQLRITCGGDLYFPQGIMTSFKKLKSLDLRQVIMDRTFLPSVAQLSQLTSMRLKSEHDWEDAYYIQINLLSNLVVLSVLTEEKRNPLGYIKAGALPRLQYFKVTSDRLNDAMMKELRTRLPCLRTCNPSFWI